MSENSSSFDCSIWNSFCLFPTVKCISTTCNFLLTSLTVEARNKREKGALNAFYLEHIVKLSTTHTFLKTNFQTYFPLSFAVTDSKNFYLKTLVSPKKIPKRAFITKSSSFHIESRKRRHK